MSSRAPAPSLDRTLSALAHPVRRKILDDLVDGTKSVGELAQPFEMSLPAVSMHIRTLARAGLVTQGRDGQLRPCRLNPTPMKEISVWLECYRMLWEQSLDRLDEYAQTVEMEIADRDFDA